MGADDQMITWPPLSRPRPRPCSGSRNASGEANGGGEQPSPSGFVYCFFLGGDLVARICVYLPFPRGNRDPTDLLVFFFYSNIEVSLPEVRVVIWMQKIQKAYCEGDPFPFGRLPFFSLQDPRPKLWIGLAGDSKITPKW